MSQNFVILHKKNFFKKSLDKKLSMWYNGNSGRGNRTRPAILSYFFSLVKSFYKKNKKMEQIFKICSDRKGGTKITL